MNGLRMLAVGTGGGKLGRQAVWQAVQYEKYLITARACGISKEQAKAVFEEEMAKPGGFDEWLQAAKWRVTSGGEA